LIQLQQQQRRAAQHQKQEQHRITRSISLRSCLMVRFHVPRLRMEGWTELFKIGQNLKLKIKMPMKTHKMHSCDDFGVMTQHTTLQ
jgi:hypothetical protein